MKRRLVLVLCGLTLAAIVGGLAIQQRAEQRRSIEQVEQRFSDRVELASQYVVAHLGDMAERQARYGREVLWDAVVSAAEFDDAVTAFGFEAGVLLDKDGRALAVSPRRDLLLGTDLASGYSHLRSAVAGRMTVSDVVLSAANQERIVAVAVPFDSEAGRRVISGGYELSRSPLSAFLAATSSLPGREVYLVDGSGQIVASSQVTPTDDFSVAAPGLAAVRARTSDVSYRDSTFHVARVRVAGTRWHLVSAVPRREMLAVAGSARSEWQLILTSAVLAFAVLLLVRRLLSDRESFRAESRTDNLTSLANRTQAQKALDAAAAASERTGAPFAVAFIDIDHFKRVNDTFGHDVGDRVLQRVGSLLADHSRRGDVVARWGGEEFLVIMQDMDALAAARAADRLVSLVRSTPVEGHAVTISVGVSAGARVRAASLVHAADEALYRAKAGGRDRVEVAPSFELASLAAL